MVNQRKLKMEILLRSTLTCPKCHHQKEEQMPITACQFLYKCVSCNQLLRPLPGDCCVFCSYGTESCPTKQEAKY